MTLTKPPVIPEGWNPNSNEAFNSLMLEVKKDLLPKGIKAKKTPKPKKSYIIPFSQNKLRTA